jgi:hypothetical protein
MSAIKVTVAGEHANSDLSVTVLGLGGFNVAEILGLEEVELISDEFGCQYLERATLLDR